MIPLLIQARGDSHMATRKKPTKGGKTNKQAWSTNSLMERLATLAHQQANENNERTGRPSAKKSQSSSGRNGQPGMGPSTMALMLAAL
jgi:hypothetical protein